MTGSVTAEKVFVHTDPGSGNGSGDVRLDKLLAKVCSPHASANRPDTRQRCFAACATALWTSSTCQDAGSSSCRRNIQFSPTMCMKP